MTKQPSGFHFGHSDFVIRHSFVIRISTFVILNTMTLLSIIAMLLGFGFVIFWHELGHFLGCRLAGIRVEQFAVGMGHAVVSYRKGIGIRPGNTMKEFERRTDEELKRRGHVGDVTTRERYDAAAAIGLGETEYRLSMLPIGGYVKPTGQDDLRPSAQAAADDPGSFAAASVGHRMVMISAGVIMNVILAGILFFVLFQFVGFKAMKSGVGQVQSGSPAAQVGLRGGDELLSLNGHTLHDFTKILMNVALLPSDEAVDLKLLRDGREQTIKIQARKTKDNNGMLAMGVSPIPLLVGRDPAKLTDAERKDLEEVAALRPEATLVKPGERIVAVNGEAVGEEDYAKFDRAIQQSFGGVVNLTIGDASGATRPASFRPKFAESFDRRPIALAGMMPRTRIATIADDSTAKDKLKVGDVVLSIRRKSDSTLVRTPSPARFIETIAAAGKAGDTLTIDVERDGATVTVADLAPTLKLPNGNRGLGVQPIDDVDRPVVATVVADSSAAKAGVTEGATIASINGTAIANWADLHRAIVSAAPGATLDVRATSPRGEERFAITPDDAERKSAEAMRYANPLVTLAEWTVERKNPTNNPLVAIGWGVTETRDLILQGYLTLQRVFGGSVPASNMSGPVGIFRAGTAFAQRGTDWFVWFLAVISANLAVVNFLPIPILDGWHFLGLLKEKITGKPVSERVQVVAQYIGLAMILSLLVFVTVNDLTR